MARELWLAASCSSLMVGLALYTFTASEIPPAIQGLGEISRRDNYKILFQMVRKEIIATGLYSFIIFTSWSPPSSLLQNHHWYYQVHFTAE